jgi:catechol 2,3-dioxygenase-like lactoylglutathione lyase family enzyme
MPLTKPLVGAIKSALIRVRTIEQARPFYEGLLGLRVIAETGFISDKTRRLWGLQERPVRCLRLGKPGENFGLIDLIELAGQPGELMRDAQRPWDYGWFALGLQTRQLDRAIEAARALGAQLASPPHSYEAGGQQVREVMFKLASGERCIVRQVGAGDAAAPLFGEPLATMCAVVPSLPGALAFYRDALGLSVIELLDQTGGPLAPLLGAPASTRLQKALLTAGGNRIGKFELLQLALPPGMTPQQAVNWNADGVRLGFWMMSVMTPDLDLLQAACRRAGVNVVRGPATIDRPCFGRVRALIVRAPGGELLECMAVTTGTLAGR